MRLENTTILRSISPVQIKHKPSLVTYEFVATLFANVDIVSFIKQIRRTYRINESGLVIHKLLGTNLLDDERIKELLDTILLVFPEQILTKYGIHKDFVLNISLLIYFNSIIDLEDYEIFTHQNIEFVTTKKNISNRLWDLPYEACALIIPYANKVSDIKNYLEDNKEDIENKMQHTLFKNTFIQKIHERTQLASEIIHMHDDGKKTFSQIAEELSEKYPENKSLLEDTYVNKLYRRYKVYWELNEVRN